MESVIQAAAAGCGLLAPALTMWAIAALYTQKRGQDCALTQALYFFALMAVAGLTIRAVTAVDGCWLTHTASLGGLIVAGVMRRPAPLDSQYSDAHYSETAGLQ